MSKWKEEFIDQFRETGTVKELTNEIKDSFDPKRVQKAKEKVINEKISNKLREQKLKKMVFGY